MVKGKKLCTEPAWCKGCGYCVDLCPKNVLTIQKEKVVVADPDNCICCSICEQHCPDYAIWVEDEGEPEEAEALRSGQGETEINSGKQEVQDA